MGWFWNKIKRKDTQPWDMYEVPVRAIPGEVERRVLSELIKYGNLSFRNIVNHEYVTEGRLKPWEVKEWEDYLENGERGDKYRKLMKGVSISHLNDKDITALIMEINYIEYERWCEWHRINKNTRYRIDGAL